MRNNILPVKLSDLARQLAQLARQSQSALPEIKISFGLLPADLEEVAPVKVLDPSISRS
jgi:hypothetical protein